MVGMEHRRQKIQIMVGQTIHRGTQARRTIETWVVGMIHLDTFSGIGGFSLGLRMAGFKFERTYYSDIDKYANMVYAKNFPDAIALGDVTKIDGKEVRKEAGSDDIILTAGFP